MSRDESLPVLFHERQEVGLLLGIQRHFAVAQEKDAVHVVQAWPAAGRLPVRRQRMLRDDVGVGADVCVVQTRLVTEALDDGQGMRDRVVLRDAVPRVGPCEHDLANAWTTAQSWPIVPAAGLAAR